MCGTCEMRSHTVRNRNRILNFEAIKRNDRKLFTGLTTPRAAWTNLLMTTKLTHSLLT